MIILDLYICLKGILGDPRPFWRLLWKVKNLKLWTCKFLRFDALFFITDVILLYWACEQICMRLLYLRGCLEWGPGGSVEFWISFGLFWKDLVMLVLPSSQLLMNHWHFRSGPHISIGRIGEANSTIVKLEYLRPSQVLGASDICKIWGSKAIFAFGNVASHLRVAQLKTRLRNYVLQPGKNWRFQD